MKLFKITINEMNKLRCSGEDHLSVKLNDWCIIQRGRFEDIGRISWCGETFEEEEADEDSDPDNELYTIIRKATLVDQGKANENKKKWYSSLNMILFYIELT